MSQDESARPISRRATARWIGDATRHELRPILHTLQRELPVQWVPREAMGLSHDRDDEVQLVVLSTLWTHEDSPGEIPGLRQQYPQATILQIFGPWCEARPRGWEATGRVHRIPWHAFPCWWAHGRAAVLATSETDDTAGGSTVGAVPSIGIVAAHEELATLYLPLFQAYNLPATWLRSLASPRWNTLDLIVWDGSACGRALPPPLSCVVQAAGGRPVVALGSAVQSAWIQKDPVDFVAKPFDIDALMALVGRRADRAGQSTRPLARSA